MVAELFRSLDVLVESCVTPAGSVTITASLAASVPVTVVVVASASVVAWVKVFPSGVGGVGGTGVKSQSVPGLSFVTTESLVSFVVVSTMLACGEGGVGGTGVKSSSAARVPVRVFLVLEDGVEPAGDEGEESEESVGLALLVGVVAQSVFEDDVVFL